MDGFNVIPVEKGATSVPISNPTIPTSVPNQPITSDGSFEIFDEVKEVEKKKVEESGGIIFTLSILSLLGVFGYFGYLVYQRSFMLSQIANYANEMRVVGQNIDKKEMQEFQSMDTTLNTINGRLQNHVLNHLVMALVNNNIRSTLQISEYRLDVKLNEVEVNLNAIAPSFKELAEQTEKLFSMKDQGLIKSFVITNLSFESDTKRMRFSMRLIFDRSKLNAAAIYSGAQNN